MFARGSVEPEVYKNGVKARYGDFADRFLKAFPGDTKEQAAFSSADMTRDQGFGWGSWTWARLQSRTGKSKVFMYYFEQKQPEMPNMPFKLRGAPHAAEIKYVLQNIDEKRYGAEDLKLSETMATYWTNFAKNGDPNGENVPVWDAFTEQNSGYMYFNNNPAMGPVPNLGNLELFEEYYKTKREAN
jgi:para-nitrobenzyl esterase